MALIDFIVENRQRLMEETNGEPFQDWFKGHAVSWPDLHAASKWETFQQTFKRIKPALEALIEADRERDRLQAELNQVTQELHKTRERQTKPALDTQAVTQELPKIEGWKVQKSPDGYFRAHRRIEGRMYSCYLGKDFNLDSARAKIEARERKIREAQPSRQESKNNAV